MTRARAVVRPFPAYLVRQEYARRTVTAMSESQDESGVDLYRFAVDPAAYQEFPTSMYVYRQGRGGSTFTGIVCEVAVQAVAAGRVRGHESVQPLRVEALVWHHARGDSPPALVKLLHRAGPEFTRVLADVPATEPVLDFPGPFGFRQTLWRLGDGAWTEELVDELSAAQLYIADGHHRTSAALLEWRTADRPPEAGLLCVLYGMHELHLSAFHRRVSGPIDTRQLLALLADDFDVRESDGPPTPSIGRVGLYVSTRWYAVGLPAIRPSGAAGLDASILHTQVLDRLVPGRPGRIPSIETVPATTPLSELVARCDADDGALFTLAPPTPETVTEVADAGEVMPPKTTCFEPKPAAGIFLRRTTA